MAKGSGALKFKAQQWVEIKAERPSGCESQPTMQVKGPLALSILCRVRQIGSGHHPFTVEIGVQPTTNGEELTIRGE